MFEILKKKKKSILSKRNRTILLNDLLLNLSYNFVLYYEGFPVEDEEEHTEWTGMYLV